MGLIGIDSEDDGMLNLKPTKMARPSEAGMSLIELLFAGFILTIGMLGSLVMITTAIATNQRNKTDTVGTALGQTVIEEIATLPTSDLSIGNLALKDCAGTVHNITVKAPLNTDTVAVQTAGY